MWRNTDDEIVDSWDSHSSVFDDVTGGDFHPKRNYPQLMGKAAKKLKKHNKTKVIEKEIFEVTRDPLTGNMVLQIEPADLEKFSAEDLKKISEQFAKHQEQV